MGLVKERVSFIGIRMDKSRNMQTGEGGRQRVGSEQKQGRHDVVWPLRPATAPKGSTPRCARGGPGARLTPICVVKNWGITFQAKGRRPRERISRKAGMKGKKEEDGGG